MTYWSSKVLDQVDIKDVEHKFFVRLKGNLQEDKEKIQVLFGKAEFILFRDWTMNSGLLQK